jgi:hypothetical protein
MDGSLYIWQTEERPVDDRDGFYIAENITGRSFDWRVNASAGDFL